jgi:hypothetical protein
MAKEKMQAFDLRLIGGATLMVQAKDRQDLIDTLMGSTWVKFGDTTVRTERIESFKQISEEANQFFVL